MNKKEQKILKSTSVDHVVGLCDVNLSVYDLIFPRWLNVIAYHNNTEYHFKSENYAEDFFMTNKNEYPHEALEFEGHVAD